MNEKWQHHCIWGIVFFRDYLEINNFDKIVQNNSPTRCCGTNEGKPVRGNIQRYEGQSLGVDRSKIDICLNHRLVVWSLTSYLPWPLCPPLRGLQEIMDVKYLAEVQIPSTTRLWTPRQWRPDLSYAPVSPEPNLKAITHLDKCWVNNGLGSEAKQGDQHVSKRIEAEGRSTTHLELESVPK